MNNTAKTINELMNIEFELMAIVDFLINEPDYENEKYELALNQALGLLAQFKKLDYQLKK